MLYLVEYFAQHMVLTFAQLAVVFYGECLGYGFERIAVEDIVDARYLVPSFDAGKFKFGYDALNLA